jgi:hypothetical protein
MLKVYATRVFLLGMCRYIVPKLAYGLFTDAFVKIVRISRSSRHLDSAVQRQMWEGIANQARHRRLI